MSIRVTCPNGHHLVVKDSCAGKVGLCPACKARVAVPKPSNGKFTEDDIADLLSDTQPHTKSPSSVLSHRAPDPSGSRSGVGSQSRLERTPPKKSCVKCNREIASGTHICPFCRTYIASLGDL